MSRAKARETAFRMAFQMDVGKNDFETSKETMLEAIVDGEITKKECPYIENVVQGIAEHREELDAFIEKYAKGWSLQRINPMDKNIIRLALYEVWYVDNIPMEVALNEAIELAKLYGEEDSYSFVNGILDNVKDHLK